MKFLSIINLLLVSAGTLSMAAPTPSELAPSARALADATNLICGQYPDRSWVLIGQLMVNCDANIKKREAAAEEKRSDSETSVDADWIVEYRNLK